mgnify:CR=1 FL=1
MIVDNFTSLQGHKVANQFEIKMNDFRIFQSYKTIIAVKNMNTDQVILDRSSWDCSRTTSKYRTQFLGEITQRTRVKVNNGTYMLKDLNRDAYCDVYKFVKDVRQFFIDHVDNSNKPLVIPTKLSVLESIRNDFMTEFEK